MRLILLTSLMFVNSCLAACDAESVSDASSKEDRIATAIEGQECPTEGCYWLEVQGIYGDWIKTSLVFGFLGNGETCEQIAENLMSSPSGPLPRIYRCSKVAGT